MIILLMPHRQPLLHELFAALGVDADAHWIAGRRGILSKNLPHLVEQTNRRIQKIFGRKPRGMRSHGRSIFTVSYTHLDVYKRQFLHCAAGCL